MGRPTTFDDKTIFEAIGRDLAVEGKVTTSNIQKAVKLSTGSLYHRFGSREAMLAEAWLFAVKSFQEHVHHGFDQGGLEGAVSVALATPRFCREERNIAMILVCGRPSEFLTQTLAAPEKAELDRINSAAAARMVVLALQLGKSLTECRTALVSFPLGAVRSYLPKHDVPQEIDDIVARTVRALLG